MFLHQVWIKIGPEAQEVSPVQKDAQDTVIFVTNLTNDLEHSWPVIPYHPDMGGLSVIPQVCAQEALHQNS